MAFDLDDEELKATRKLLGVDKENSIEEDIKILKSYLDNFKYNVGIEIIKSNEIIKIIDYKEIKAIEHLLLDYTRQKQINEEHQKINGELREKVKELEEQIEYDKTHIFTPMTIDLNYISKQKIKNKIEKLKDTLKHYNEYSKLNLLEKVNVDLIDARIEILQELLQESEDK